MRRAFATGRTRTVSFACLLGFVGYANPVGYRHTYRTAADRLEFARTFGANRAIQLFYGTPHSLLTVGGYTAWRTGSVAAIASSVWALLAIVRATRAEEDAGRQDLVLAEAVARRTAFASAVARMLARRGSALARARARTGRCEAPRRGVGVSGRSPPSPRPLLSWASERAPLSSPPAAAARSSSEWARCSSRTQRASQPTPSAASAGSPGSRRSGGARTRVHSRILRRGRSCSRSALERCSSSRPPRSRCAATSAAACSPRLNDSTRPRTRWLGSPAALAFRGELGTVLAWLVASCLFAVVIGLLSTTFTTQTSRSRCAAISTASEVRS